MEYNAADKKMKKFFLFLLFPILFFSCSKSDDWFMDNGWHEAIVSYENPCGSVGDDFFMEMDSDGNIVGFDETGGWHDSRWARSYSYRLYSSFDKLHELETAPSDGYTETFVCNKKKYGVARFHYSFWINGDYDSTISKEDIYCKFYVKRINSRQVKVYYKEWYYCNNGDITMY